MVTEGVGERRVGTVTSGLPGDVSKDVISEGVVEELVFGVANVGPGVSPSTATGCLGL